MNKLLLIGFFVYTLTGCQKDKDVLPYYPDWYILKGPEPHDIRAAYGDIDGTLIIATNTNIYLTNDRGKTWRKPNFNPLTPMGLYGLVSVNDTLMVLDGLRKRSNDPIYYATSPTYISMDKGENWKYIRNPPRINAPLNILKVPSGLIYSIHEVLTPVEGSPGDNYVQTVGIKVSDGRELTLPQRHQIRSIYFDKKQRLYVAGSAAVCGSFKDFKFCGDKNGMLYVSKQPQP